MIDYNKFISRRRYNTRTIRIASKVAQTPTFVPWVSAPVLLGMDTLGHMDRGS